MDKINIIMIVYILSVIISYTYFIHFHKDFIRDFYGSKVKLKDVKLIKYFKVLIFIPIVNSLISLGYIIILFLILMLSLFYYCKK